MATFGKELLTRLTMMYVLFVILVISRFGFDGLIASVLGLCILFTSRTIVFPSASTSRIYRSSQMGLSLTKVIN